MVFYPSQHNGKFRQKKKKKLILYRLPSLVRISKITPPAIFPLKGLSHDKDFDDKYGLVLGPNRGQGHFLNFLSAPSTLHAKIQLALTFGKR